MMSNVHGIPDHKQQEALERIEKRILQRGGEPPYDGDMEARLVKLEEFALETRDRLTRIETKLDTFATKADLHEMGGSMIKWMVGTAVGLGVAAITVMTFVLNNASPKVPAQQAQAPIIINIPAPQQPPAK